MKKRPPLLVSLALLIVLPGCQDESATQVKAEVEQAQPVNSEFPNARREYVGEHNYISYNEYDDSEHFYNEQWRPRYFVYKAKEWPREDLNDSSSYELPRVQFKWGNGRGEPGSDAYERREKIWSMKTDGSDLRLVTDAFEGSIRGKMKRSPDNRYLAYGFANVEGVHKALFDLKTQETRILGSSRGLPIFLWAEDGSYLYYSDDRSYYKYDMATQKAVGVDTRINETGVIYKGKRILVGDFGYSILDEKTGEYITTFLPEPEGDIPDIKFYEASISPTGRYVWATTRHSNIFMDTQTQTFKKFDKDSGYYYKMKIMSLGAKFRWRGPSNVILDTLTPDGREDKYHKWAVIGSGQSATNPTLYNAFANNGDFLVEAEQ
ncbi:SMP-30/gluconolactonase/LRE family protein [Vibrio sp. Of7-15]|uniref:SMP-30/gluconolactonase/LRE family protein n=1 Tax=Vibrio sp. Of7-15 TaxID=2724879 RepID=UPI001EF25CFE|nr:SMP-30/gluconolactonase/LRE family protein [Vibrio sp. Of7-15]MCG7499868.1 SMP-30/gluconolactonase/LRE family protein [Vibrio sp. Of7-15]